MGALLIISAHAWSDLLDSS